MLLDSLVSPSQVGPFDPGYEKTFEGHKTDDRFDGACATTFYHIAHRHCALCDSAIRVEQVDDGHNDIAIPKGNGGVCESCKEIVCDGCLKDTLCAACFDDVAGLSIAAVEVERAMASLLERANAENNPIARLELRKDVAEMRTLLSLIEASITRSAA